MLIYSGRVALAGKRRQPVVEIAAHGVLEVTENFH